ncbi:MAG: SDR family oxidoreductase [Patescibacteria group bacterium]
MTHTFNQSVAIITGGASGIGKSLVQQLAALGAKVIIVDRNDEAGNALASSLKELSAEYYHADMAINNEAQELFEYVLKTYGRIDYVFNCAGIFMAGEIRDTPLENWQTVINNNIWAVNNGTHYAYQVMLKQGNGHIINIASAAGLFPVPVMSIYGASKFAIVGLTHGLRNEAKTLGINVSVVCPTVVNTPLYDTAIYNNLDKEKALKTRSTLQTPDVAAEKIIKGVAKNKATIHTAISTQVGWFAYKYVPGIYNYFAVRVIKKYRTVLRVNKNS